MNALISNILHASAVAKHQTVMRGNALDGPFRHLGDTRIFGKSRDSPLNIMAGHLKDFRRDQVFNVPPIFTRSDYDALFGHFIDIYLH